MDQDIPPYYRRHVFVCTNERPADHPRGSCAARGSGALRDHMKKRAKTLGVENTRVNIAGCLDRCELGPCLVVYPEGVWYRAPDKAAIDEIVERHLERGEIVEHLRLRPEDGP